MKRGNSLKIHFSFHNERGRTLTSVSFRHVQYKYNCPLIGNSSMLTFDLFETQQVLVQQTTYMFGSSNGWKVDFLSRQATL